MINFTKNAYITQYKGSFRGKVFAQASVNINSFLAFIL